LAIAGTALEAVKSSSLPIEGGRRAGHAVKRGPNFVEKVISRHVGILLEQLVPESHRVFTKRDFVGESTDTGLLDAAIGECCCKNWVVKVNENAQRALFIARAMFRAPKVAVVHSEATTWPATSPVIEASGIKRIVTMRIGLSGCGNIGRGSSAAVTAIAVLVDSLEPPLLVCPANPRIGIIVTGACATESAAG
jgi:hypothetical protein